MGQNRYDTFWRRRESSRKSNLFFFWPGSTHYFRTRLKPGRSGLSWRKDLWLWSRERRPRSLKRWNLWNLQGEFSEDVGGNPGQVRLVSDAFRGRDPQSLVTTVKKELHYVQEYPRHVIIIIVKLWGIPKPPKLTATDPFEHRVPH